MAEPGSASTTPKGRSMAEPAAPTAAEIREAFAAGCPDCVAAGTTWVHLRICLQCRHAGCCDDSPETHARKHWQETGTR